MVWAPGLDGLFDLLGGEVFGGGSAGERWEFWVGGEAEGDELGFGKGLGAGVVGGGEEGGEAEALFEADDAVLRFEGGGAGD